MVSRGMRGLVAVDFFFASVGGASKKMDQAMVTISTLTHVCDDVFFETR